MENLEYNIQITADKKKVWSVMLEPDTYKEWAGVSWPGSDYEGAWGKGESIKFISPGQGGTLAKITEYRPHDFVLAEHIGIVNADGSEDTDSDAAKGWIGTTESYTFTTQNGKTDLKVNIKCPPEWVSMFNDGWPKALDKLKEMCEG
jgi:uncharacterized protein YndB with AHSA1/START domain